jgi:hypothetical protein
MALQVRHGRAPCPRLPILAGRIQPHLFPLLIVVSRPAVLAHVHARNLHIGGHPQPPGRMKQEEQGAHERRDPPRNDKNVDDLRGKQLAAAPVEQPVRGAVVLVGVRLEDELLLGEQPDVKDAERAAAPVQLEGLERVVVAEAGHQLAEAEEHPGCAEPAEDGGPRLEDVGARGDGGEAGQEPVTRVLHLRNGFLLSSLLRYT